jgi:hypothetical protein
MSKPFSLTDIRSILPDNQENPQEQNPMYIDWGFYNWGKTDIPPEQEPFKATVSLDLDDKHIYMTVEAKDTIGNDIDVPPEAYTWAKKITTPLINSLMEYEGVTNNATT